MYVLSYHFQDQLMVRTVTNKYTCLYILHVAAFRRCILVGGLNVYISHYFKYIGTLKTVGRWRWRTAKTLYSTCNLFRTKEKPGGNQVKGGGLAGFYCIIFTQTPLFEKRV